MNATHYQRRLILSFTIRPSSTAQLSKSVVFGQLPTVPLYNLVYDFIIGTVSNGLIIKSATAQIRFGNLSANCIIGNYSIFY